MNNVTAIGNMTAMPLPPKLDGTIGAIEIGVIFSFFFMGSAVVQAYTYYQSEFSTDPLALRALVTVVCSMEVLHTAFVGAYLYITTITNFGNYEALEVAHWTLAESVPIANFVMVLVQSFFAYRIYCLSQRWLITIVSWIGSAVRLGSAIGIAVVSHRVVIIPTIVEEYRWLVILCYAVGAVIDVLNTLALSYYLFNARTKIMRSRKMLERLMMWTIETGLITSFCNVLAVIFVFALPHGTAFLCMSVFTTKMYSNSFLASLNGRLTLRSSGAHTSYTLSTLSAPSAPSSSGRTLRNTHGETSEQRKVTPIQLSHLESNASNDHGFYKPQGSLAN